MLYTMQEHLHNPEAGVYGDCFRASLSSILHLPIEEVPHFLIDGAEDQYHSRVAEFLAPKGLMLLGQTVFDMKEYKERIAYQDTSWFHLASGPSPAFADSAHCVVGESGSLIHDPHPRNLMIPSVEYFEVLVITDIVKLMTWMKTRKDMI